MKTLACAIALTLANAISSAQPVVLVTEEEAWTSRQAIATFAPRVTPAKDAPVIEIRQPSLNGAIASPTPIEIRFRATPPATVRPESFKVSYGAFRIDITSRLARAARVDAEGILVKEATLPAGRHRLFLSIEDTEGRIGSRQIEFEII